MVQSLSLQIRPASLRTGVISCCIRMTESQWRGEVVRPSHTWAREELGTEYSPVRILNPYFPPVDTHVVTQIKFCVLSFPPVLPPPSLPETFTHARQCGYKAGPSSSCGKCSVQWEGPRAPGKQARLTSEAHSLFNTAVTAVTWGGHRGCDRKEEPGISLPDSALGAPLTPCLTSGPPSSPLFEESSYL